MLGGGRGFERDEAVRGVLARCPRGGLVEAMFFPVQQSILWAFNSFQARGRKLAVATRGMAAAFNPLDSEGRPRTDGPRGLAPRVHY